MQTVFSLTDPEDFIATTGYKTFYPGDDANYINITLIDDNVKEFKERFQLNLWTDDPAVHLTNTVADIFIQDHDSELIRYSCNFRAIPHVGGVV